MNRAGLFAAAAVWAVTAAPAGAHPHVWVDARTELQFTNGVLGAVKHAWTFDELFSAYASQGLDTNGDGSLSREELQPLAQTNVESLADFEFFTFLKVGKFDVAFAPPADYWLEQKGERLTLHFTLPIEMPLLVGDRKAVLEVYDPTFFVDFSFPEDQAVTLAGSPGACSLRIERAGGFDPKVASRLAEIPADIREIPDDLLDVTSGNANRATVSCD